MEQKIIPIKKTRVSEEVFRQLYEMIRGGTYKAGDQLPNERDLAEQFQVSRASIREALRTLQTMGLLESLVGVSGGNFIKEVDFKAVITPLADLMPNEKRTLQEVMEYRLVLETEVARLAAERRTDEDLDRIRSSLAAMEADVAAGGIGLAADTDFHEDIARATHNDVFLHMLTLARTLLSRTRETSLKLKGVPQTGIRHHRNILDALVDKDAARAAEAMRKHLLVAQKNVARG